MTISGEDYAHVSCGCEHGGLLGAYKQQAPISPYTRDKARGMYRHEIDLDKMPDHYFMRKCEISFMAFERSVADWRQGDAIVGQTWSSKGSLFVTLTKTPHVIVIHLLLKYALLNCL